MGRKEWRSVSIMPEVHDKLRKEAEDNDRNVSQQLTHILKQYYASLMKKEVV